MSLGKRIKEVRKALGDKTQSDFARSLGISVPALQGYESDKNVPGGDVIKAFTMLGVDIRWLLTGEGTRDLTAYDMIGPRQSASQTLKNLIFGIDPMKMLSEMDGFALIPQYEAVVAAGPGAENGADTVKDRVAFRRDWLRENGLDPEKLVLVRVTGDSMLPTLTSGDVLMLDLRASKAKDNAIYAIEGDGLVRVKRLQPKLDGSIVVKSDNPAYEMETIPAAEADRLRVIGRAVWVGKKL